MLHSNFGVCMQCVRQRSSSAFWHTMLSPKSQKLTFKPNEEKLKNIRARRPRPEILPKAEKHVGPRFNALDIQMLPKNLYEQIFKNFPSSKPAQELVENCIRTLQKHGMVSKEIRCDPEINLKLPPLQGRDLLEHFQIIGEEQAKPYRDLVLDVMGRLPKKPANWMFREGWTRYSPNEPPESVAFPLEDAIIFDVEVCMSCGKAPTLATAVTNKAWYGWVSQTLADVLSDPPSHQQYHEDLFIPLEDSNNLGRPKVVIGHNVSYDRAKIREQYWVERTGMRFVDTMSLHICVSGLTSYQRAMLKSKNAGEDEVWKEMSSLNNLSDVHKLYCGSGIEKEVRNLFIDGSLSEIRNNFQSVMNYCSNDVAATHAILTKLFPLFLERFPHPVTFAGMLELGTAYLPVNDNWMRYVEECERTYEDYDTEGKVLLAKRADQACQLLHDDKYKEDIWMWDMDWSVKDLKIRKTPKKIEEVKVKCKKPTKIEAEDEEDLDSLDVKFAYLEKMQPNTSGYLPGYPAWYKKLCTKPGSKPDWVPGPNLISTSMQITPKLLNLTWEGYPLHYIRGLGWGLLVPFSAEDDEDKTLPIKALLEKCPLPSLKGPSGYQPNITQEVQDYISRKEYYNRLKSDKSGGIYKGSAIWSNTILEDCVFFFKLPHKNGPSCRVGNPLARDFLNKFSENVLAGDTESAEQVLEIARKLSYWRNNRDRIRDQMVVWLNKTHSDEQNEGAILPQVVVCGTLTRRAVEPTWMTASNAQKERIGSELRAMVQAPKGYKIVGADVDSQELWIASVIGDASFAHLHGATPLGWMTLSGSKADGTDMHSVTAKAVGISRDHAKVINYARIYGAGQNFAEQLLKQFNPSMSPSDARKKALKMFDLTKGKRIYQLRQEHMHDLPDVPYNKWQAFDLAKVHGKNIHEMFHKPRWVGGTESAMFNSLEDIASELNPITPFLGCRLSRALEPQNIPDDRFLPTRVNWVVQSGAVDFLHLMLVCMRWILKDKARFCLSFHDEIRYLVREENQYKVALAMHVTNLLTRSYCAIKLGIYDLPNSVAFFSSVEIDQVLRKEAKHDCKTPSNPHGLEKGYGIPNGESLDAREALVKAQGERDDWFL